MPSTWAPGYLVNSFSLQSDGEIGEEELYYDIYENNLGGKVCYIDWPSLEET